MQSIYSVWNWLLDHPAILVLLITLVFNLAMSVLTKVWTPEFEDKHPGWHAFFNVIRAAGIDPFSTLKSLRDILLALAGKHPVQIARKISSRVGPAIVLILVGFSTSGCAASFEETRLARHPRTLATQTTSSTTPAERCISLDNAYRNWGMIAKISGVGASAAGVTAIPLEDKTAKIVAVSIAVGLGMTAAGAVFVSESYATTWTRECSQ